MSLWLEIVRIGRLSLLPAGRIATVAESGRLFFFWEGQTMEKTQKD